MDCSSYLTTPARTIFLYETDYLAEEVMKTNHLGSLYILMLSIPVSYLSTLAKAHPSRIWDHHCPIDRIQVASDNAFDINRIDLLLESVLFDSSTALWADLKINMDLRGIEPTLEFLPGLYVFQTSFNVGIQVFLNDRCLLHATIL